MEEEGCRSEKTEDEEVDSEDPGGEEWLTRSRQDGS